MIDNSKEYILCAAVWFDDGFVHEHQPTTIITGLVVCGRRHHNCFLTFADIKGEDYKKINFGTVMQGFMTSLDRFVSRKEAAIIAFNNGQILKETETLFSEDLY